MFRHLLLVIVAAAVATAEPLVSDEAGASIEPTQPLHASRKPPLPHQTATPTPSDAGSDASADEPTPPPAPPLSFGVALRAARPWSFTATIAPVLLGTAVALQAEGTFNPLLLLLSLGTTLSVHAAGNLMNTLFDYLNGYDSSSSSDLTLVSGLLSPRQFYHMIAAAFGAAAVFAAPIAAISQVPVRRLLAMLGLGAASSYVYTGGPGLKYRALGDVLITGTFGPLLVAFAFCVQTGGLIGWRPIAASIPVALHIEAILHANNGRDVEEDVGNGVITLAAMLGKQASSVLYGALILLPYVGCLLHAYSRSVLAALPLVSAPQALRLVRDFSRGVLRRLPMRTAKFQFLFGMLTVAGVLIPAPAISSVFRILSR